MLTNALTTPAKDLFARYPKRMTIENELDAYISGFHLDALSSALPLNVDLDTTLTVVAGSLYRMLARKLPQLRDRHPRPDLATLPRRHRHPARHQRHRHRRPQPAHLPPRAHRRRPRRPRPTHPLVGQPTATLPLPTPITKRRPDQPQLKYHTGD